MPQQAATQPLLHWYRKHKRALPWRETNQPYAIWISETMLQQTQVSRVIGYYQAWMRQLPTVQALAASSLDNVFRIWEGLGYYSRARNLHLAAQTIVNDLQGHFPDNAHDLRALPGIGPYTSAAIASIAFREPVAAVDANVKRVMSRLHDLPYSVDTPAAFTEIEHLANTWLPKESPGDFNQAMMELGALICLPRRPDCPKCPLHSNCQALAQGRVTERPIRKKKPKTVQVQMATGIALYQGKIFLQKRLQNDVWGGLWEFPGGAIEKGEPPQQAVVREFMEETGLAVNARQLLTTVKHTYTHHLITLHAFWCEFTQPPTVPVLTEAQDFTWAEPEELAKYAFSAGHRAVIQWITEHKLWNILQGKNTALTSG